MELLTNKALIICRGSGYKCAKNIMKSVANILSASRIVLSFVLLPLKVFSIPFYILYAICALTDILDGFAARKTQSESEFGAKLDSISDTVFVAVCMIKLLTVIEIKIWLWIWIALIAAIKLVNIISGYVAERNWLCCIPLQIR